MDVSPAMNLQPVAEVLPDVVSADDSGSCVSGREVQKVVQQTCKVVCLEVGERFFFVIALGLVPKPSVSVEGAVCSVGQVLIEGRVVWAAVYNARQYITGVTNFACE